MRLRQPISAWAMSCLVTAFALSGCAARASYSPAPGPARPAPAVSEEDIRDEFQPDRPDTANGTHIVPTALAQLEAGGQWSRMSATSHEAGTPLSLRLGVRPWLEARVETDGLSHVDDGPASWTGFDGLSLGAKVRVSSAFALQPAVNLPVGVKVGTDYLLTLITGTDFAGSSHVDVNYGLASAAGETARFFQQWAAVSASRQVTDRLSPYAEIYWFSKQDAGGGRIVATDFGAICTFNERFALDGGVDVGRSAAAPGVRLFAGLSVVVGEVVGHRGVHERLREAASRRLVHDR